MPCVEVIFFLCVCTYIPDNGMVAICHEQSRAMYRLGDNKFTETGKTRLRQAEEERRELTGFKKLNLYT